MTDAAARIDSDASTDTAGRVMMSVTFVLRIAPPELVTCNEATAPRIRLVLSLIHI